METSWYSITDQPKREADQLGGPYNDSSGWDMNPRLTVHMTGMLTTAPWSRMITVLIVMIIDADDKLIYDKRGEFEWSSCTSYIYWEL